MEGTGKTTLAKVLFNELLSTSSPSFQCCSFLKDIRGMSDRPGHIEDLQEKLIRDLVGHAPRNADLMQMIRKNFQRKKVLIVLDDVNQKEQIVDLVGKGEYFGPGSRIIVTTTDSRVLQTGHGPFWGVIKMEPLKAHEALELLSWHAFSETSPPEEYEHLAKIVASACENLPLSLTVIGSFLEGKRKIIWDETANKLEKVPHQKVYEKLRISYDALEDDQKQMFLDIAIFFNKKSVLYPWYMWQASDFHPASGLDALISLDLVAVENNKFSMHGHLVALGREIVRAEALQFPFKCSRYWDRDGPSLDVLKNREVTIQEESLINSFITC